jgi:hypothetical protein
LPGTRLVVNEEINRAYFFRCSFFQFVVIVVSEHFRIGHHSPNALFAMVVPSTTILRGLLPEVDRPVMQA